MEWMSFLRHPLFFLDNLRKECYNFLVKTIMKTRNKVDSFKYLISQLEPNQYHILVNGQIASSWNEKEIEVIYYDDDGYYSHSATYDMNHLTSVTLLDDKVTLECYFDNYYHKEDGTVKIQVLKITNFKGWVFDN